MRIALHQTVSISVSERLAHQIHLSDAVLGDDKTDFGLLTDDDHLWKKNKREKQRHQVKRAEKFLETLFANAEEQVIVVVTHSGFIRSLLLAVDREPYRPKNAEMVPAIIEVRHR